MSIDRLTQIRTEEREYHDQCYGQHVLFEPGSWLHKPVRTVLELLPAICDKSGTKVLDLGAGIGRNTIPIAQYLLPRDGEIVAVDLLESAVTGLKNYAMKFGVEEVVTPVLSDIESFRIEEKAYDLIIAVSALEHLRSLDCLQIKLHEISQGLRQDGAFCLIMGTNIREVAKVTGEFLDPMFELLLSTEELIELLRDQFQGWEIIKQQVNKLHYEIDRQTMKVMLSCDCLTWIVRKQASSMI